MNEECRYEIVRMGDTICRARNEHGLSQQQLTNMVDTSKARISDIEGAKVNSPGLEVIWKICYALDLDTAKVFPRISGH